MKISLAAIVFLAPLSALAVPESNLAVVKDLLANRDGFFRTDSFSGVDSVKISYTRFGAAPGAKGCLVIAPGQGEAALKFIEVAYDLSNQGFSPVYVIDHRGQGLSGRLLPDPQKDTVKRFADYATDFENFVDNIVMKDPACQGHPASLLSHSMGGAIVAAYLEAAGENTPFRKAAFSSPMMKIRYPQGKTEDSVIAETWFACNTPFGPKCDDFAPGKGPYNGGGTFAGNPYTHSEPRFDFKRDLYASNPAIQIGGPTVRWVREAALANKEMRKRENAQRMKPSLLILSAGNDQLVDNAGQEEICGNAAACRLEKLDGSNHEILMESDSIRDIAIAKVVQFLSN